MRETFALAALLGAALAGCSGDGAEVGDEADLKGSALTVEAASAVSLLEISALASLGDRIVAGGDRDPALVTFELGGSDEVADERHVDLSKLPVAGAGGSQWEGLAADGVGNVFVLSETPSSVYVLDPKMGKLLHTIALEVPPDSEQYPSWSKNTNSRGEGIVLLESGHLLIAIEKDPPSLGEFGPAGSAATGYQPGASPSAAFPLPSGKASKMELLHVWRIKTADRSILKDISELAVGPDQRLYAMSQEGRAIVRIERELAPDEDMVDIKAVHRLPSDMKTAEGLVILQDGRPVVAEDRAELEQNLFVLSALPPVGD